MNQENSFFDTPVKKLVGRTRESVADWMLKSSDYVSSLLAIFTDAEYHRLLVIDEELLDRDSEDASLSGSSIVILTQTDLLRYIWKSLSIECKTLAMEVSELGWRRSNNEINSAVLTCAQDMEALVAYRLMFLHRKNSIAVVDKEGRIISNLSASDLRGLHHGNVDSLLLPVYEFLETNSRERNGGLLPDQLRTAKPDTPLDEIVQMILDCRIHRVWITNDNDEPVGVVSITDILCLFSPENARD